MNVKATKTFLYVSNAVVALLCVFAILGYFLMPLWQMKVTVNITPEFTSSVSNIASGGSKNMPLAEVNGNTSVRLGNNGKIAYMEEDESDLMSKIAEKILETLSNADLSFSYTLGIDTSTVVRSIVDRSTEALEKEIDKATDEFINLSEDVIDEAIEVVIVSVAQEVIKNQINDIIKNNLNYPDVDQFLADIGADDDYIEGLVKRVFDAVMSDTATVQSVTDTIMEVIDEFIDRYSSNPKYADDIGKITAEDKSKIRSEIVEAIEGFADESGKIALKDSLIKMMLTFATENLSRINGEEKDTEARRLGTATITYASAALSVQTSEIALTDDSIADAFKNSGSSSYEDVVSGFKAQIKAFLLDSVSDEVLNVIMIVLAVIGILVLITLLMLAYPIIRALTKIGADNPGYGLWFIPIVAGFLPFALFVLIPGIALSMPALILGLFGGTAADVAAILSAVKFTISSGSIVAFIVSIVLFIFSFFYAHYRRALKRELAKAAAPEAAGAAPVAEIAETEEATVEQTGSSEDQ